MRSAQQLKGKPLRRPVRRRLTGCLLTEFSCLALLLLAAVVPLVAQDASRKDKDKVTVDEKTDAVIKGALRWLGSKQLPNGAWGSTGDEQRFGVAITGYVLMAFEAAGQLPGEGEFGKNVSAGMQYLLDQITPEGLFANRNSGQYMYGHGIASIALAELYGQTRSAAIRPKLEKLIRLIIASQNREGGWRYRPVASDADISVTVLQVVALRAAKNGGIDVPQVTIDNAVKYVKSCQHAASGGFAYQPGRDPGFARTAAAIYSLQVCGLYDDPMVQQGSEYLFKNYDKNEQWFTYGNFYAAPAQYMIGGETWSRWYARLKEILLKSVTPVRGDQFYWEPKLDAGLGGVGPSYCTAVYAMILAMPYHYVPLYQR
jgi:prenyltransferase beta subunit